MGINTSYTDREGHNNSRLQKDVASKAQFT